MPAWPGGPCPNCGDDMPANLVHCQRCRQLLNEDLESDSVVVPEFVPLQEISAMIETAPDGFFVACPQCDQELRIHEKYLGQNVACKHCDGAFRFDLASSSAPPHAFYVACPHCEEELRAAQKYLGKKVQCKHCQGHIHLLTPQP